jgi:hypothetical protein
MTVISFLATNPGFLSTRSSRASRIIAGVGGVMPSM